MPVMGLEPILCCHKQILSLPRLPIPTHRLVVKPTKISILLILCIVNIFFVLLEFFCFYSKFCWNCSIKKRFAKLQTIYIAGLLRNYLSVQKAAKSLRSEGLGSLCGFVCFFIITCFLRIIC